MVLNTINEENIRFLLEVKEKFETSRKHYKNNLSNGIVYETKKSLSL